MKKFNIGDIVYDYHSKYIGFQIGTIMEILRYETNTSPAEFAVKFPKWPHYVRRLEIEIKHVVEPGDLMKEIL